MSIENKLTYLESTKGAIKQAIVDKGVSVSDSDTFRSYAEKIGQIQSGGSGDCPKYTLDLTDGVSNTFRIRNEIKDVMLPSNMDNVTSLNGGFDNCSSLTSLTLPDLPNVKSMDYCFQYCKSLTSITFPTSLPNVTTITGCFGYTSLRSIILPDLPKVENMNGCFNTCVNLKSITFPTSLPNVTTITGCFGYCYNLTSITLPSSLPNVTNVSYCFHNCSSLTSITLLDLPKVENMSNCFNGCRSLTSITLPDLPLVTTMSSCFANCSSLQNLVIGNINPNITTLSNWVISTCTLLTVDSLVNIMNALPTITNTRTCTIGTTNLAKLSPEQLAIGVDKGWSIN